MCAERWCVTLKAQGSRISADIADIDKAIMAHRNQIENLTIKRRKLLEELQIMGIEFGAPEIIDIQDLISGYRHDHPSCKTSELRSYLVELLEKEYGIGIVVSYPMIDAALNNELFRYRLKKRAIALP